MEFNNSAFSAFLFKETEASPITAYSNKMTCFDEFILSEICGKINKNKRQNLRTIQKATLCLLLKNLLEETLT